MDVTKRFIFILMAGLAAQKLSPLTAMEVMDAATKLSEEEVQKAIIETNNNLFRAAHLFIFYIIDPEAEKPEWMN